MAKTMVHVLSPRVRKFRRKVRAKIRKPPESGLLLWRFSATSFPHRIYKIGVTITRDPSAFEVHT
jgi:hypothetical protein